MGVAPRVVIDGLWRCLCPSIDAALLAKPSPATRSPIHANALQRPPRWVYQTRAAHTDADTERPGPNPKRNHSSTDVYYMSKLRPLPTKAIYEVLQKLRGQHVHEDQTVRIRRVVRYLIEDRGEKPNIFLYEALVVANWDSKFGSADELVRIWNEMRAANIPPSQRFLHAALKLLVNHPNFVLRQEILDEIRVRGFLLSDEGEYCVALGLLRETQYELAVDKFQELIRSETEIPLWVFDIFIYELGKQGFLEEAIDIMRQRPTPPNNHPSTPPDDLWYFLLDRSSQDLRYEDTKLLWDLTVERGTLTPSDGMLTNVLNTAARYGDAALATQVIQLLSGRLRKLALHHYEALIDCYVHAGDVRNAVNVLFIMSAAGVQPETASTRSLHLLLKRPHDFRSPDLLKLATAVLSTPENYDDVPVPAMDLVLEVLCERGEANQAVEVYRDLSTRLQSNRPSARTFELLLGSSLTPENTEYLLAEARFYGISPADVYDRLVAQAVAAGEMGKCMRLLARMEALPRVRGYVQQPWLRKRTLLVVLKRLFADRDPRAWDLVELAGERGVDVKDDEVEGMLPLEQKLVKRPRHVEPHVSEEVEVVAEGESAE
ncbi:hypothetical protein QBC39DRAFT_89007 [Podospora conica]|nr:hypothetical protein QBC39DRAFT_89007 [Schizothecium conicum]